MSDNTYGALPEVPVLDVHSTTFPTGGRLPAAQVSASALPDGRDLSPELEWATGPAGTRSYAVTCFDPDAPTGAGWWHWALYGLPASVTRLPEGAGTPGATRLPASVRMLRHDGGAEGYLGAAPPVGHGDHRYIFAVHALDLGPDEIHLDPLATPTLLAFTMFGHTLARGVWVGLWGH